MGRHAMLPRSTQFCQIFESAR